MKKISLVITLLIFVLLNENLLSQIIRKPVSVQQDKEKIFAINYGLSFSSRYLWRGLDMANSPAFEPYGSIGFYNFDLNIHAVYGTNAAVPKNKDFLKSAIDYINFAKIELHLNYNIPTDNVGTFRLGVADYLFPLARIRYLDNKGKVQYRSIDYLDFTGGGTGSHTLEGNLMYSGPNSFPMWLFYAYNFHNDPDYSWYVEAGYKFKIATEKFQFHIGGTKGPSSWYGMIIKNGTPTKDWGAINVGIGWERVFPLSENLSLPIGFSYIYNAFTEENYVIFKATLNVGT
jgi:hypothetical protein